MNNLFNEEEIQMLRDNKEEYIINFNTDLIKAMDIEDIKYIKLILETSNRISKNIAHPNVSQITRNILADYRYNLIGFIIDYLSPLHIEELFEDLFDKLSMDESFKESARNNAEHLYEKSMRVMDIHQSVEAQDILPNKYIEQALGLIISFEIASENDRFMDEISL